MTSSNPFSAFLNMYCSFEFIQSTKRVAVVEYARRGGIYSHFDGRIDEGGFQHNYMAGMEVLSFRLHTGDHIDLDGFAARHELKSFNLMNDGWGSSSPSFETAAGGTIGILHGFTRDGWPVDVILHAVRR